MVTEWNTMKILIYIIFILLAERIYAGAPPLLFKVNFKNLETNKLFSQKNLNFSVQTSTIINSNTNEWNKDLKLEIIIKSQLCYNFFNFPNHFEFFELVQPITSTTAITFTEGLSNTINLSSSNGYSLDLTRPGIFQQAIYIEVERPQWEENNLPSNFEVNIFYSPVLLLVNEKLFTLEPNIQKQIIKIDLSKK